MVKQAKQRGAKKVAKTKQKSAQNSPNGMASNRALIILYVLIAIVLGWLVIHIARTAYEQRQYDHARANLNALYDEIVTAVGKPDKAKDDASCGYVSQEFGRGARYCNIDKYIAYKLDDANAVFKNYGKIVSTIKKSKNVTYTHSLIQKDDDPERQGLDTIIFENSGIKDCSASFLNIRKNTDKEYARLSGRFINVIGLSVDLYCSGGVQKEYFPVRH
jgi:hypothetical protein